MKIVVALVERSVAIYSILQPYVVCRTLPVGTEMRDFRSPNYPYDVRESSIFFRSKIPSVSNSGQRRPGTNLLPMNIEILSLLSAEESARVGQMNGSQAIAG